MSEESKLIKNITKLEKRAKEDCKCPSKPKCKSCLANDYLGALSRMASRGVESTK